MLWAGPMSVGGGGLCGARFAGRLSDRRAVWGYCGPMGVVGGHGRVPLLDVPPLSALVILLAIPIVLVASNVIAVYPARRVARAKPVEALRSE